MYCLVHETRGFSPLEDKNYDLSTVTTRKAQILQKLLPHPLFMFPRSFIMALNLPVQLMWICANNSWSSWLRSTHTFVRGFHVLDGPRLYRNVTLIRMAAPAASDFMFNCSFILLISQSSLQMYARGIQVLYCESEIWGKKSEYKIWTLIILRLVHYSLFLSSSSVSSFTSLIRSCYSSLYDLWFIFLLYVFWTVNFDINM
jgi:hypothetical protein